MRVFTVFQPTSFCNLACRYCWAPDKDNVSTMSLDIVRETLTQLYRNSSLIKNDILWLTGEPLAAGLEHFKSAVAVCKELSPPGFEPSYIVQTNGTLINEEWAKFFREHDFVVGVTIDGPQETHDHQRVNKAGEGTFHAAMNGIDCLIRNGVKGGALCVITRKTLEIPPDDLFHFFQSRRISWSYLLEARIGENTSSDKALTIDDQPKLERFLGRLIELWGQHPNSYIRDFEQLSRRLFGCAPIQCDYDNLGCLDIINVTADGHYFWGNPELMTASKGALRHARFNIFETNLWQSRTAPGYLQVRDEIHRGVRKCQAECPHFAGCQGGNPAHKFYEFGRFDVSDHLTCRLNDQVIPNLMITQLESALA